MIKNTKEDKLSYAAKVKTSCKCYRGAKIKEIQQHLQKECEINKATKKLQSIVIHAGTNDLSANDLDTTADEMENLIISAKSKAKNVAVSSIIKRYDNKVPDSCVTEFNKLVQKLCKKDNITYIDNYIIDRFMLNRSNLHLNNNGDKLLRKAFCSYFRSLRSENNMNTDCHFFWPTRKLGNRPKNWTACMSYLADLAILLQN